MVLVQIVDDSKPNPRSKFVSNVPGLAASNELICSNKINIENLNKVDGTNNEYIPMMVP